MAKREQTAEQLKFGWKLTDEQKAQVLSEVQHYLAMDCYDFGINVGGLTLLAGELAEQCVEEPPRNEDASRRGSR